MTNPQKPHDTRDRAGAADGEGGGRGSRDGKTSGGQKSAVAILIVCAVVVVGGYVAYSAYKDSQVVSVGDCIEEPDESDPSVDVGRPGRQSGGGADEPTKVDCGDPDAHKVVLGERAMGITDESCLDIDGADAEVSTMEPELRMLCLGPVGVDPALSVNTVTDGECVVVEGEDARRSDCAAPEAMRVLAVLDGVSDVPDPLAGPMAPCEEVGIENAQMLYSWGLVGEYSSRLSHDRGLCLTPAEAQG